MADAAIKNLDLHIAFARLPALEAERGKRGGRILGGVANSFDHGAFSEMSVVGRSRFCRNAKTLLSTQAQQTIGAIGAASTDERDDCSE
jgi:hypothetical protein